MGREASWRRRGRKSRARTLDRKLLACLRTAYDRPGDEEQFNRLALEVYRHQYAFNPVCRALADSLGRPPRRLAHYSEIPAVPTDLFKQFRVASFPARETVRTFETSGTTHGRPGRLDLDTMALYDASLREPFRRAVLPDCSRMVMLVLMPPLPELPRSSLVYMLHRVREEFGQAGSDFVLREGRLEVARIDAELRRAEEEQRPIALLGTVWSLSLFLEHCSKAGWSYQLPDGSRIMQTGGFKTARPWPTLAQFLVELSRTLGVPRQRIVGEYGMTEMASQYYQVAGERGASSVERPRASARSTVYRGPPWVRFRVVAPETLEEVPIGKTGLLVHYDLANRGSALALMTADLACRRKDGFELLGRAPGASERGCSLGLELFLTLQNSASQLEEGHT